ncbi:MAG: VPLPA-CTERM sorting domain-containing protein [Pseudomonadota bacterium]
MRAIICGIALTLTAMPAQAVVTFFTDEAAFDTATSGLLFTTDDFSTDVAPADQITFASGVISLNQGGVVRIFEDNSIEGGVYNNAVDGDGGDGGLSILWTFPEPVTAVGFQYFDLTENDVNVSVDGSVRALREGGDPTDGFFGFTTTTPVTEIIFDTFDVQDADVFDFDDLQFAGEAQVVPLPGALPLLLAGLAGLAVVRQRRR